MSEEPFRVRNATVRDALAAVEAAAQAVEVARARFEGTRDALGQTIRSMDPGDLDPETLHDLYWLDGYVRVADLAEVLGCHTGEVWERVRELTGTKDCLSCGDPVPHTKINRTSTSGSFTHCPTCAERKRREHQEWLQADRRERARNALDWMRWYGVPKRPELPNAMGAYIEISKPDGGGDAWHIDDLIQLAKANGHARDPNLNHQENP